jgi:hypothetical protein
MMYPRAITNVGNWHALFSRLQQVRQKLGGQLPSRGAPRHAKVWPETDIETRLAKPHSLRRTIE